MTKSRAARLFKYTSWGHSVRDLHLIKIVGKEPEELNAGLISITSALEVEPDNALQVC
jgi:hypothetical protein